MSDFFIHLIKWFQFVHARHDYDARRALILQLKISEQEKDILSYQLELDSPLIVDTLEKQSRSGFISIAAIKRF